jgi:hypothetical protein
MRRDMRLVQRRRVENRVRAINAPRHAGAVNYRPDLVGERPGDDVEPDRFASHLAQRAHQRFAQMPRTAGDKNGHGRANPGSDCLRL